MSTALAIAGVTAVLCSRLNDGMIDHTVNGLIGHAVTVSALPPDRVIPTSGTEPNQVNLFLYQVSFNAGWRNQGLPSRDGSGQFRLSNPPLAVDLHYILSAYSADELGAEILLGFAMQFLHEEPVLDREAIRAVTDPTSSAGLPSARQALAGCALADQVEQIKIVPQALTTEELSKIWTATQSHLRTTAAYLATVVLIDSIKPTKPTLPVLSRGKVDPVTKRDEGVKVFVDALPPYPTTHMVRSKNRQASAIPGSIVEVIGHHLPASGGALTFSNDRFKIEKAVVSSPGASSELMEVVVPPVPVGVYRVTVNVGGRPSNTSALLVGPTITTPLPMPVPTDSNGDATINLTCAPDVEAGQQVSLLMGDLELFPEKWSGPTHSFTFVAKQAPKGQHLIRLRVDGIDSPIIDRSAVPPAFYNYRVTIT